MQNQQRQLEIYTPYFPITLLFYSSATLTKVILTTTMWAV